MSVPNAPAPAIGSDLTHFSFAAVASSSRFCACLVAFSRRDACLPALLARALSSGARALSTRRRSPSLISRWWSWLYLLLAGRARGRGSRSMSGEKKESRQTRGWGCYGAGAGALLCREKIGTSGGMIGGWPSERPVILAARADPPAPAGTAAPAVGVFNTRRLS